MKYRPVLLVALEEVIVRVILCVINRYVSTIQ